MVSYASASITRNGTTCEPGLFTPETKDPSIAITGLSQEVSYFLYVSAVTATQGIYNYVFMYNISYSIMHCELQFNAGSYESDNQYMC